MTRLHRKKNPDFNTTLKALLPKLFQQYGQHGSRDSN